ncbi:MAG: type II toxin-antitoxin system VapC family toxin [Chitinispirillales bacterium]|jgi:tRNA(fMet)-specific endonuclease VapC|nr:type II toxin-antitoxin system VapC family toxin [Chitinispirillales bacterium]
MIYFLDTNICIHYLNDTSFSVTRKIDSTDLESIKIPTIVAAELYYGASKSKKRDYNLARYAQFVASFGVATFDHISSRIYGGIRAALEAKGSIIGGNDLMIAAAALAYGAILVTDNVKEFSRVDSLIIENWTQG